MTCEKTQERFADYLTGDLDETGRREVQEHILDCAACRQDLEDLTVVWAKLGVLPDEQPGGGLRHRFYTMLEEYKHGLEAERRAAKAAAGRGWRDWFSFRRPAFAAAFSAFLLILGAGAGWFAGGRGPERAGLSRELQDMRQQVALSLLSQPSAADRLQGIGYSTEVSHPKNETLGALFDALDADPNPNVRLAAVEALYLFRDRPGVKERLVQSLSLQTYPLVQVALIDFLVEVREARAAEALRKLVESGELTPEVKKRAEMGLRQIV